MATKLGKAKYGGGYVKKKYWKLKDGESVFRILPPFGDCAEDGIWSKFYNVHYGYKNSKGEMRTFQSPLVKNRKTKMIETPDPALERIETIKAKLAEAKDKGDRAMQEKLEKLAGGQKSLYNMDNHHYLNAMDEQGNIGILKIRHRAKLALDDLINELRDKGIDPLDPENGRFLVFRRSGNALETSFKVTVKKEQIKVDGIGMVERDVVHTLTEDVINRLEKEGANLTKLFKRPTSEEVARIVKESDLATGKCAYIDELFDTKNDGTINSDEEEDGEEETSSAASSASSQAAAPSESAPAAAPATQASSQAAAPKAESLSTPSNKTTAESVSTQSDEDFLKSLGV